MKLRIFLALTLLILASPSNGNSIPSNPYTTLNCSSNTTAFILHDAYPSTPYKVIPFQDDFKNPPEAVPTDKVCRDDGHCIYTYQYDVADIQLRVYDRVVPKCKEFQPTWFLSYGYSIPARTFRIPQGHESIVRFNNKISGQFFHSFDQPCKGNRSGRPISIHNHGFQSLSPFDGWAQDRICFGETKDYIYPNNLVRTGWYHDHSLKITADNAYFGLAGMYIVSGKKKQGGCGEPFNLEDMEQKILILADKVLDKNCQLLISKYTSAHHNHFYADINTINGVPFPVMKVQPKWYRFRMLNVAASRPWLVRFRNENNKPVSTQNCWVIASDGGYKENPTRFPKDGLLIGVAERWEFVCDFSPFSGQTLYMWNEYDPKRMLDVPYFCNSHLLSKILVAKNGPPTQVSSYSGDDEVSQSSIIEQDEFPDQTSYTVEYSSSSDVAPYSNTAYRQKYERNEPKPEPKNAVYHIETIKQQIKQVAFKPKESTQEPQPQATQAYTAPDTTTAPLFHTQTVAGYQAISNQLNNSMPTYQRRLQYQDQKVQHMSIGPVFDPTKKYDKLVSHLSLSPADFSQAKAMVKQGKYHRKFDMEYRRDHWVINNKGWQDAIIAAQDVGQNTWEVWLFRSGGGWFHPVHIHLIDFFLLARSGEGVNGIQEYEYMAPKDVFYLGANNHVWLVSRFGAHKGDYMFHCHNLIHEDNDMLRAFRVTDAHKGPNAKSVEKFIVNPLYNIVYSNFKYADPMLDETLARPSAEMPAFNGSYFKKILNENIYTVFYPTAADRLLYKGALNPWEADICSS